MRVEGCTDEYIGRLKGGDSWGPVFQVRHPGFDVVKQERAKGGIEVHFQPGGLGGEGGEGGRIVERRAEVDAVVTARFLRGRVEGELERGGIYERGLGVGHRQYNGDTPREGGGGSCVEVFFVRPAGFAQVDVDVYEAGESDHG